MESSNQFDSNQTNGTKSTKKGLSAGWVVFIALATLILGGALAYWYASNNLTCSDSVAVIKTSPQPTVTVTASPEPVTFDEEKAKEEACKQLDPDATYVSSRDEIDIEKQGSICGIENISENHAQGYTGEQAGSGAHFLAVKTNGSWEQVEITQDVFNCITLWQYSFPGDVVDSCGIYDTDLGKVYEYIGFE